MAKHALFTTVWSAVVSVATVLFMQYAVAPRLPVSAVEVPPLVGLSPEQARGLLEPRGLLFVIDGERVDPAVGAGTVSEQRPLGGSRLHRGDEVRASIARTQPDATVPNVVGLTPEAAQEALKKAHLQPGRATPQPSATTASGLVAASIPAAGAQVKPDGAVDLVVSSGPVTQAVPAVVGKRLSRARQLLETAGFAVGGTRYGSNDDYEQGIVIGQNPVAGAQAAPGAKIDLVIND